MLRHQSVGHRDSTANTGANAQALEVAHPCHAWLSCCEAACCFPDVVICVFAVICFVAVHNNEAVHSSICEAALAYVAGHTLNSP